MNEHLTPTRFSKSPEFTELDGKTADHTHPQAVTFCVINDKVVTTGRPHLFIFNALTTLALPEHTNEVARGLLQRLGPEAFLRDYRFKVWPSELTEDDLQWFRERHTGDLGEMRRRTQSGRVWAEADHHGGMVTLFSFWVTAAQVPDETLSVLCECVHLHGASPIGVEYVDSVHPVLYSPTQRRTVKLQSKVAPELSPREIIDLLVQANAAATTLTATQAAVCEEFRELALPSGAPAGRERSERPVLPEHRHNSARYSFQVADKKFSIQYLRMTYLEGYDDAQLARLAASRAFEVTFRLEDYTMPDGTVVGGFGTTNTGHAFQILGGVANGILDWAERNQPEYLYWYAQGTRRQRLYDRMIRCFSARGSGMCRLQQDPFTGMLCVPEMFWLARSTSPRLPPVPHESS